MTINCNGKLIDLSTPKVMGVLNLTPDSFYDGGKFRSSSDILRQTEKMLNEEASFIDVGGYSSRPGADFVSEEEELRRVISVVELLTKTFPGIFISVDTFRSQVALKSVEAGACIINDISAGHRDDNMLKTVSELSVPYIMMHSRGTSKTMQQHTDYNDLLKDILFYFSERIAKARELGIIDLIIDPGFGFAKTLEQNFELLNKLELLKIADLPMLIGVSRKSMIYKTLETTSEHALNGTSVLNAIALTKGAKILRVHDVKQAVECVKLTSKLN
ncbi:MAG: dihydropteroate synthase [Bacteroidota bacterium]